MILLAVGPSTILILLRVTRNVMMTKAKDNGY